MRCIALRHVAFEDLGLLAPLLAQRGFDVEWRQAGVTPLSADDWRSAHLVVVLGGPIGVGDVDRYPWLDDEIAGLRMRLQACRPTLGICLGAQLMAAALGARVYAGAAREIGWDALTLTDDGAQGALAALAGVPVLHWHGDTFDLPERVVRLASTALTANQAFALDDFALALQFHAEVDGDAIEPWLIGHTCELAQAGVPVKTLRARSHAVAAQARAAGAKVFAGWLDRLRANGRFSD